MDAHEVIESYVTEVALRLPRRQRDDVAFELRALLGEELQARADAAGRAADAAMATGLVQAFGRPADVAARYRPTLTVIDPADGHAFVRAAGIGLAILWGLGLWLILRQPAGSGGGLLGALGQWWGSCVIPSLWWPGVLVVGFGTAAWSRRRWPSGSTWKPRAGDRIHGGRAALALGLVGMLCGTFVLLDPRWVLDVAFGGRAAPAAYAALTYTETFRQRQAVPLLVLLLLNIPLSVAVLVNGRWSALLRRAELGLSLVMCAALTWTALDGPVLLAPAGDRTARALLIMIVAATLAHLGLRLRRSVRPAPSRSLQAR